MRFVLALVLLSGCAAPIQATRNLPQPQTLAEVNRLLDDKRVTIELADGERIPNVTAAVVTPDDVRFYRRGAPHAVPIADVARIVYVRNRGTKKGALVGLAPGAGLLALGVLGATQCGPDSYPGCGAIFIVVGAIGGAAVSAVAVPVGAWMGQGVSPGGIVPLYQAPVSRYLSAPDAEPANR